MNVNAKPFIFAGHLGRVNHSGHVHEQPSLQQQLSSLKPASYHDHMNMNMNMRSRSHLSREHLSLQANMSGLNVNTVPMHASHVNRNSDASSGSSSRSSNFLNVW